MKKSKKRTNRKYEYKGRWKIIAAAAAVLLACILITGGPSHDKPSSRVVAYLPSWNYESFTTDTAEKITHLNVAFVNPDAEGKLSIGIPEKDLKKIIRKAHRHDVKVLMSLGGGGCSSNYASLTASKSGRKAFTSSIMDYAREYGFDGIDINIEGEVEQSFWSTYESWILQLRKACDRKDMLLTCATASWFDGYISNKAFDCFDYISIMAYDNRGAHNHSSYDYARSQLTYFSDRRHIDEDRLTIGIPFYGYRYANGTCTGEPVTFGEIARYNKDSQYVDESGTCRYNGIDTVKKKTVLGKEYGGVMIWSLGQDASGEYSLLKAIYEEMSK